MAKTNAQRQAEWRERRDAKMRRLERENEELRAENERLRREAK